MGLKDKKQILIGHTQNMIDYIFENLNLLFFILTPFNATKSNLQGGNNLH